MTYSKADFAGTFVKWGGERNNVAFFYVLGADRLLWEIMDYSLYLAKRRDDKTVRNEIWRLKGFIDFLLREKLTYQNTTDALLEKFRDEEYSRVRAGKTSGTSERSIKRTVNAKLRRTYKFLYWLQEQMFVVQLMGVGAFPVQSTCRGEQFSHDGRFGQKTSKTDYPTLFDHAGNNGGPTRYEATEIDVQKISARFHSQASSHAAQRNILMMDLATMVAWRRESVNSLTCDQFSNLDFSNSRNDDYIVVPPSQKFGYEKEFEVPFRLAFRIAEFIAIERKEFLLQRGWSEAKTQGRIFISEQTGGPLKDGTISAIFGAAFKALERPRGANFHSFRRKFANDKIDDEILNRLELGLSTSEDSITASVASSMGHSNPSSLQPYVNKRIRRMVARREKLKQGRLRALEEENEALKAQVARLMKGDRSED